MSLSTILTFILISTFKSPIRIDKNEVKYAEMYKLDQHSDDSGKKNHVTKFLSKMGLIVCKEFQKSIFDDNFHLR